MRSRVPISVSTPTSIARRVSGQMNTRRSKTTSILAGGVPHSAGKLTCETDPGSERVTGFAIFGERHVRTLQPLDCGAAFRLTRRLDREPGQAGPAVIALTGTSRVPNIAADVMMIPAG